MTINYIKKDISIIYAYIQEIINIQKTIKGIISANWLKKIGELVCLTN